MSARVFNSHMSEMRRVLRGGGHVDLSESDVRSPRDNSSRERIKRCLFGPIDHNECHLFVQQQMESHRKKASKKWNFEFETGEPRPLEEGDVYEWKILNANEAVPEAYALSRLPYLNKHAESSTTINSKSEKSQSCSSSSSSIILAPKSTKCNKQTTITKYMREQKTMKRIPPTSSKSEPSSSVKEEEPPTKKSRACTSKTIR